VTFAGGGAAYWLARPQAASRPHAVSAASVAATAGRRHCQRGNRRGWAIMAALSYPRAANHVGSHPGCKHRQAARHRISIRRDIQRQTLYAKARTTVSLPAAASQRVGVSGRAGTRPVRTAGAANHSRLPAGRSAANAVGRRTRAPKCRNGRGDQTVRRPPPCAPAGTATYRR